MFPVVLFITSGHWAKVIMLVNFVTLPFNMMELLVLNLVFILSIALSSELREPSIGNYNNYTFYLLGKSVEETSSYIFPFF